MAEPLEVPPDMEKPMFAFFAQGRDLKFSRKGLSISGGPGAHSGMGIGVKKGCAMVAASLDNVDGTDPWSVSRAEVTLRKKMVDSWQRMRKEIPGYENSTLMAGSYDLGVREPRLLDGEYQITLAEMLKGTRHKDAVFQTAMPTDAHLPGENWSEDMPDDTFDVPYRILVPQKVDNLLVAGRCTSMDHPALAALRKVPLCIAMGEAAGTAAALSVKLGVAPRKLDVATLQRQLLKQGVLLSDQLTKAVTSKG